MTKEQLLAKLKEIKDSTKTIMDGGVTIEQATGNATENQGESKESI